MKSKLLLIACICPALAGCAPGTGSPVINLPENIVAMAAPGQDLSTVRVRESDGCYWYRHTGPVETTELPLRNVEGRPICTRAPA